MRFDSISSKQAEIFTFPHEGYDALICDGAVRTGKTVMMTVSFIEWAMHEFSGCSLAICGKTVRSAERNILMPLMQIRSLARKYQISYTRSISLLTIKFRGRENYFYVFGGKDESSYMLIQGITLCGILMDEVALMPQSFVDQAIARTLTIDNAKLWFNCNPDNPMHWFYRDWILKPVEHNAKHLHFLMGDNPGLSEKAIEKAKASFSGVFYDRYILGKWVAAEGLIYPDIANGQGIVPAAIRSYVKHYISIDYGTLNPFSAGLWGLCKGTWYRYDEYYHSGRETRRQLTDNEYYEELERLAGDRHIEAIIIDPSAASMIAEIRKHGRFRVIKADNDVVDGIRETAKAFKNGMVAVCNNCSGAISEFSAYCWDDKKQEDKPIKENDHAMDDIRYFVNTVIAKHNGVHF